MSSRGRCLHWPSPRRCTIAHGPARSVGAGQTGGAAGRHHRAFAYALLQAVSPFGDVTLQQGLRQLVEAELMYQRGSPPQATYTFKHALIQDAAYHSLLRSTRQQYHQRIAQAVEAQFPETVAAQPGLVAHHYTAARPPRAGGSPLAAGGGAIQRSAPQEAITHLTTGLQLLPALPETPERTRRELDMQIVLGRAFEITKGQGALEVGQTFRRARELCDQVGDTAQRFFVLAGLYVFALSHGEFRPPER